MPKMSVDHVVGQLAPWDLRLMIDNVEYQTKPLTIGDIALLTGAVQGQDVNLEALVGVMENMFHIKPDVRSWTLEQTMVVVQTVVDYIARRQKKTAPSLADLIRAQAESSAANVSAEVATPSKPSTSGN